MQYNQAKMYNVIKYTNYYLTISVKYREYLVIWLQKLNYKRVIKNN